MSQPNHRIVVVGGDFSGLLPARRLKPAYVRVTLVDRTANHVFQLLLYPYATGTAARARSPQPYAASCCASANRSRGGGRAWQNQP